MNKYKKENGHHFDWEKIRDFMDLHPDLTLKEYAKEFGMHWGNLGKKIALIEKTENDFEEGKQLKRIAKSRLGLKKERRVVNVERSYLNKEIREKTLTDLVVDKIQPRESKIIKSTKKVEQQENPILVISDIHYKDDNVSKRIQNWGSEAVSHLTNPKTITIINLSDTVESELHRASQFERTLTPMQQIVNVSLILTDQIQHIHEKFPNSQINYYEVEGGNHNENRILSSLSGVDHKNTLSSVTRGIMEKTFLNNNKVDIYFKHSFDEIIINNKKFHLIHGQELKSSDSSKNVINFFTKRQRQYDLKYDYILVGHFHQWKVIEEKGYPMTVIVCPALKDKNREDKFEKDNNLRSTLGWFILDFDDKNNIIIKRIY